jgi:hypothetical protein
MRSKLIKAWLVATLALAVAVASLAGAGAASGAQPQGNGIGSKEALASPKCDPDTGEIRIMLISRVPCARPVKAADNGGATYKGVTRDKIKVVIVAAADPNSVPSDLAIAFSGGTNQATGQTGKFADAVQYQLDMLPNFYETYGRDLDVEFYVRTGLDEASQRADALAIAEKKPFAVLAPLPLTGQLLADRKIVVFDTPADPREVEAQAPYRWSWTTDRFASSLLAAEVLGKSVWGGEAEWAGDESMQTKKRKFGIVFPSESDSDPYPDIALFEQTVKKYGGGAIATKVEYTSGTGTTQAEIDSANEQVAVPLITKLKDAGVTTVIALTSFSMTRGLTMAATNQEYFPEWFCAEWMNCSFDFNARRLDQEQWAHAFGTGNLFPALEGDAVDQATQLFQWYWGTTQGTRSSYAFSILNNLLTGVHMAGPNLTPTTFRKGLFEKPLSGGAASGSEAGLQSGFGPKVGLPYPAFSATGTDAGMIWYDPEVEGTSNVFNLNGKGKVMWMNGAKRYGPGDFPKGPQPFFDKASAVAFLPADADQDLMPDYVCTGCPSETGSS